MTGEIANWDMPFFPGKNMSWCTKNDLIITFRALGMGLEGKGGWKLDFKQNVG